QGNGVSLSNTNVTLSANQITDNKFDGIVAFASAAVITGNRITGNQGNGVDVTGGYGGVSLTVGGTTAADRDVISENALSGVALLGGGITTLVEGNYIGVDADGVTALGNGACGVLVFGAASGNVIGGTATGTGNVISGNVVGVAVGGQGTTGNKVEGNLIG